LPEASAVAVRLVAPLSVNVVPLPPADGVIVPKMLQVMAVAVKLIAVRFAPFTFTERLAGLKIKPSLPGVIVYAPLANPLKV